ncbi:MAG: hypothetical protein IJG68_00095 [Bacilli bacterium]|nr:hypothetical protein [Bacilli bacterium]
MGFTGVNIEEATRNLDAFREAREQIVDKLVNAQDKFGTDIVHNWSSPKAVEFASSYGDKMTDIFLKPQIILDGILEAAAFGVMEMARSNGVSFDASRYSAMPTGRMSGANVLFSVKPEAPNGTVGMNTAEVKNAIATFSADINDALALMDNLPREIALYDEKGALAATFDEKVANAKSSVNEIVSEVLSSINEKMATETEAIITGVQTSIEEMQSFFSNVPIK